MSAAVTQAQPGLGTVWRAAAAWMKNNLAQSIATAVLGAISGYLVNVYVMGWVYDGYQKPMGGAATSEGNLLQGGLLYALASMLVFGLIGYRRAVGSRRFWNDVKTLPGALGALLTRDGQGARVHLMWGMAVSLLGTLLVTQWLGAVLAAGLLATLPSMLGGVVSGMAMRAWWAVTRKVAPTGNALVTSQASMMVGMLGACTALMLGFFIGSVAAKLILALILVVVAVVSSGQNKPPATIVLMAAVAAAILIIRILRPEIAFANDGGRNETGGDLISYIGSPGFQSLLQQALAGGGSSALGAPIGLAIGNTFGGLSGLGPPPPPPDPDFPDGHQFPDGHMQLPPDRDPNRLTTYPDFDAWAARTAAQAIQNGNLGSQDPLVQAKAVAMNARYGPDPANWPDAELGVNPSATVVETGADAIHSIAARCLPGQLVNVPGDPNSPYVPVPGPGEPWPPGIQGAGFTTITVNGVEVLDPNNVAIVRDRNQPAGTPYTNPPFTGTPAALSTYLNGEGFRTTVVNDDSGNPVVVVPANTPDRIDGIAYQTTTATIGGQTVQVFDSSKPLVLMSRR